MPVVLVGIIGKPNAGKSTFFNAATLKGVPVADYPFTTIQSNYGVGYLRVPCACQELGVKDDPRNSICRDGTRLIPIRLIDVAGLVPGASKGRGLGNRFLDELRQADALIHVVDASGSTDEEGRPCPPGQHDPLEDVRFVEEEVEAWIAQLLEKDWPRMARSAEAGVEKLEDLLAKKLSGLGIGEREIAQALSSCGTTKRWAEWGRGELLQLAGILRRNSKPILIAANKADLPSSTEGIRRLSSLRARVEPCSAEAELLLRRASEKGLIRYTPGDPDFSIVDRSRITGEQARALELVRRRVLEPYGSTGVQQCINAAFRELLGTIVVYPVEDEARMSDKDGNVLPDAYVMPQGSTARDLAYKVHTELGESFLYAIDVKNGRHLAADSKLKDGDVIKIVATARRG